MISKIGFTGEGEPLVEDWPCFMYPLTRQVKTWLGTGVKV